MRERPSPNEWWKPVGDRISEPYASILLERLLKQPHARAFLGIADEEVNQLRHVMNEMRQDRPSSSIEASARFHELINRLKEFPMNEPHMVVPDSDSEGHVYLVLNDGKERLAKKVGDVYFLLYEKEISNELAREIEARIQQLGASDYFPALKVVRDDQKSYIGVEFIEGSYPERGRDVSEFVAFCRQVGFGPDTNITNFKQTSTDGLKYVDNDALEWLVDPSTHPFEEQSYAGRDSAW
jgi:hypothetical protein